MKPRVVPTREHFIEAFRARLRRLLAALRTHFADDHPLLLVFPTAAEGADTATWMGRLRAEREGRPHLGPYWCSAAPMPGLSLPLTIGAALQIVEDGIEAMAATMADQAAQTVVLFADPKLTAAVIARPILVHQWPRPRRTHSAGAFALHALTALCAAHLPTGEMLPDRLETPTENEGGTQRAVWLYWPAGAAFGDVATWARRTLNQHLPGAGDTLVEDVARGLVPSDWKLPVGGELVLASGLAVVYLAEVDVRSGLKRPSMAIDAGKTHHEMLGAWRDVPQDGKRHRAAPGKLTIKTDDQIERIELVAPGGQVQLHLPYSEFESMHDSAIQALRRLRGAEGLRHWAALLRLFSVEGGRSGTYRWLLDEHLEALGYDERQRRDPVVRTKAAEVVEFLAALELAIYTKGGELRERRRLLLETGRFERLDGSEWKLDGIEFQMNQRVYSGVRASTGELGNKWMPAPVELAQIDHVRFHYAHALGMMLTIRFQWRVFGEGADHLAISGSKLLSLAGIELNPQREERTWTALRKTLDVLVKVGLLDHYTWDGAAGPWSAFGVCRIYSAQWLLDRAVRGVIPEEKPPDRDKPVTGAELKTWREKRGWSQREAAKQLGVDHAAISRAERKINEPLGYKLRASFKTASEATPGGA